MAPKSRNGAENARLSGPDLIDIDPKTGKPIDEEIDMGDLEQDQDKLLNDIIGEFDASTDEITYKASITRIPKGFQRGQKEPWLFECDAAEIHGIKQRLRDGYGGGLFRIRVYRNGKLCRQVDYSIEPPIVTNTVASGDPRIDALSQGFERLLAQNAQLMDRLSTTPTPLIGGAVDPLAMFDRMASILAKMLPAAQPVATDQVSLLLKGVELATTLKGGNDNSGGSEDNIYSVLKEVLGNEGIGKGLADIITARRGQQPPVQPQQRVIVQQPQLPNNQPAAQPSPQAMGDEVERCIKYLILRAENNSNPDLYAEWLIDQFAGTQFEQGFVLMVNDPNLLASLEPIYPRLPARRQWFQQLLETVKAIIKEDSQQPPQEDHAIIGTEDVARNDTGRGGGNQSHAQANGVAGESKPPLP